MNVEFSPSTDRRYHVYVMLCQHNDGPGYIKIGYSGDVGARLSALRSTCPIPARYFGTIKVGTKPRALQLERALQDKFKNRRTKGEWFAFDFYSDEDKAEFNQGCKDVFSWLLNRNRQRWWEPISIKVLDRLEQDRQIRLKKAKGGSLKTKLIRKRNIDQELANYQQATIV